jgi:hypothetical protein
MASQGAYAVLVNDVVKIERQRVYRPCQYFIGCVWELRDLYILPSIPSCDGLERAVTTVSL